MQNNTPSLLEDKSSPLHFLFQNIVHHFFLVGTFFLYTCKNFLFIALSKTKDHLTNNLNIRHKILSLLSLCSGLSKRLPNITDYGYCCWFPQRRCKVSSYGRRHHALGSQSPETPDLELFWKPSPPWELASMIPEGGMQVSKRWKKTTVLTRCNASEPQQPACHQNTESNSIMHT